MSIESVKSTSMEKEITVAIGKNKALLETRKKGKHKTRYNYILRYMQLLMHSEYKQTV